MLDESFKLGLEEHLFVLKYFHLIILRSLYKTGEITLGLLKYKPEQIAYLKKKKNIPCMLSPLYE